MALINCPDCGKEMSDRAPACPHCGHPNAKAVTIEQTGKKWKFLQLFGVIFLLIGIIGIFQDGPVAIFTLLSAVGLFSYIFGRFGSWWYHG